MKKIRGRRRLACALAGICYEWMQWVPGRRGATYRMRGREERGGEIEREGSVRSKEKRFEE